VVEREGVMVVVVMVVHLVAVMVVEQMVVNLGVGVMEVWMGVSMVVY
jgi:hypothetical protein